MKCTQVHRKRGITAYPAEPTLWRCTDGVWWTRTQNQGVNTSTQPFFGYAPTQQRGFTLVELMVAVSIAAILLAVGIPSFRSTIASNRLTSTIIDLVGSLAQARAEGIQRESHITVCKSPDCVTCVTTGSWEEGWISVVDIIRTGATLAVDASKDNFAVTQYEVINTLSKGKTNTVIGTSSPTKYVSLSSGSTTKTIISAAQTAIVYICEHSSTSTDSNRAREIQRASKRGRTWTDFETYNLG